MTACTNHGGKARRVVTAALVGVLSVGTVPMVALAEGVSDNVTPLFAEGTEFSEGTLNNLTANGWPINDNDGDDIHDITMDNADKLQLRIDADSFTPAGSTTSFTFNQKDSDFSMRLYHADEDYEPVGAAVSNFTITSAGKYAVVVEALAGSEYEGQIYVTPLEVKGVALPDVEAIEGANTNDTQFIFTGSPIDVNFKVTTGDFLNAKGDVLVEGVDYTVSYTLGGKAVDAVEGVGTYTATLTGLGAYAGSSAQVSVPVQEFIIQDGVTVQIDPFVGQAPTTPSRVYWYNSANDTITYLDPSLVGIAAQGTVNDNGAYTFDVTVNKDAESAGNLSVASDFTANGVKVAKPVAFKYAGADLKDSYELVAADGGTFSVAAISAMNGSTAVPYAVDHIVANGTYGYNGDANFDQAVSDLAAGKPGTYEIVVGSCDDAPYNYGGAKSFTVKIYADALDADTQLYVYRADASGKVTAITSYSKLYDGTPVTASDFTVGGKGVDSDKLNVVLTDSEGRVIDEAVNAGDYKLVVTSDHYKLSGTTELPVTISKVDLTALEIGELGKWNEIAGEVVLPYEDLDDLRINTAWSIINNLDLKVGNEKLPENLDVRVQYNDGGEWKTVGTFKEFGAGEYRLVVAVADSAAANYVLPEGETSVTLEFTASDAGYFKDVQPSHWAFYVIQAAYDEGYMNGTTAPSLKPVYDDNGNFDHYEFETGVFTPEGTLTRAQVAAVLFNASGADVDETGGAWNEHTGWDTGFSDVDGTQWYGKAVYWAKQNGVINGYADGTFQADKPVTREEFVSMLANYAKVVLGDDTVGTVDAGVLADYPDGSKVTDWAEANVAWAAEKGIIGNGGTLMPTDTMTRAYCAAMMINYLNPELAK